MKNAKKYAFLLLLALVPLYAQAGLLTQVSTLLSGNISPGDESVAMLKSMFGDFAIDPFNSAGTGSAGGTGNVLSSMFAQYNMYVFTVAMVWFSYTAFASLAQTMHEGVVFGQRMSTVWMPIRIAFGSVSLMPIFGGWAFCQALMMIAALLGIAGSNSIAKVAVMSSGQFQTIVNPMGSVKAAAALDGIELNVLRMVSCQEAAGALNAEAATNQIQMAGNTQSRFMHFFVPARDSITVSFPANDAESACGKITLQFASRSDSTLSSVFGFRVSGVNYDAIRTLSMQAHADTLQTLLTDARKIVVATNNMASNADLMTAVNGINSGYFGSYNRTFSTRLAALQSSTNGAAGKQAIEQALMERMQSGGWATLGIWYGIFAEVNEAMNEMLDPVISFDQPTIGSSKESELTDKLIGVIAKAKAREALQPTNSTTSATGNFSLGQYILGGTIQALAGSSATGASGTINPVLAFKNIGDNALATVQAAFAAYATVKVVQEVKNATPLGVATTMGKTIAEKTLDEAAAGAKSKTGFNAILTGLTSEAARTGGTVFTAVLFAMFAAAALMAFYIPMIPFITWFSGLIHWLVTVVESFLGASLWALAHFDSDGEGMGSRTSYGYVYLLNNFARPLIMTLGFFIASAAVTVLGTFLFKYFGSAIASAQGNTMTGLLSIVAYLCILGVMGIALVNGCFGLTMKLADSTIGFIGSSTQSAFGGDTENKINAMFISATTRIGQGVKPSLSKPPLGQTAAGAGAAPGPIGGGVELGQRR